MAAHRLVHGPGRDHVVGGQGRARRYDLLGLIKADDSKAMLYFDITDWFGKQRNRSHRDV